MSRLLFLCVLVGCGGNGNGPLGDDVASDADVEPIFDAGAHSDAPTSTQCTPTGAPGTCNPLTQCSVGANSDACGSLDPTVPDMGCFGYTSFSCQPTTQDALTLTDRAVPRVGANGKPYINGCAPGFIPLYYAETGSTQVLCTGLCAALETDNRPSNKNNGYGDLNAMGKLPWQPEAYPGNAVCTANKKGSQASSRCRFLWPYLIDGATGELHPEFVASGFRDTLGACIALDRFRYDSDNNGTKDTLFPDCATLPPRSASTPGDFDDAADWGCQKFENSARRAPAVRDVWIGGDAPAPVARHAFD